MSMVVQLEKLAHAYLRHGGKDNRRQQFCRMVKFIIFAESMGARSLAQVGSRHVIYYWKANRNLSDTTAYNHWRALCQLWVLAGKIGQPPEPLYKVRDAKLHPE